MKNLQTFNKLNITDLLFAFAIFLNMLLASLYFFFIIKYLIYKLELWTFIDPKKGNCLANQRNSNKIQNLSFPRSIILCYYDKNNLSNSPRYR